ncbi:MAG: hemolysin III family protein [Gemmatimonadaceae bacterium]
MAERAPTLGEEIASSITHGAGLAASLVALPVLVAAGVASGDNWRIVGGVIFGVTLVLLYTASTIYHALPASTAKRVFRVLDHSAIYLLIAGTYTPFLLGVLRGPWGWSLLAIVWALAAAGITAKATIGFRWPHLSTAIYLSMGWLILVAIRPLAAQVSTAGLGWLIAGGIAYTSGVVFYAWDRLRYGHMVWHLFVAAGSVCHFFAVLLYSSAKRA